MAQLLIAPTRHPHTRTLMAPTDQRCIQGPTRYMTSSPRGQSILRLLSGAVACYAVPGCSNPNVRTPPSLALVQTPLSTYLPTYLPIVHPYPWVDTVTMARAPAARYSPFFLVPVRADPSTSCSVGSAGYPSAVSGAIRYVSLTIPSEAFCPEPSVSCGI